MQGDPAMRSIFIAMADAVTLRGIVDLLEDAPATTHEIAATQYVSGEVAGRLCKALQQAGIIEPILITCAKRGGQRAEHAWQITEAYRRGEIAFDAEKLVGGA
jgi:hypothetical protein